MTLLDTNVLIRALEQKDVEALRCLEQTAESGGAVASGVFLAEMQAGAERAEEVLPALLAHGVGVLGLPVASAAPCARAFAAYLAARRKQARAATPKTPLADFFIGGHAEACGFAIATDDDARFRTYFPTVAVRKV